MKIRWSPWDCRATPPAGAWRPTVWKPSTSPAALRTGSMTQPIRRSSRIMTSTRRHLWLLTCAALRTVTRASTNGAIAASVGTTVGMLRASISTCPEACAAADPQAARDRVVVRSDAERGGGAQEVRLARQLGGVVVGHGDVGGRGHRHGGDEVRQRGEVRGHEVQARLVWSGRHVQAARRALHRDALLAHHRQREVHVAAGDQRRVGAADGHLAVGQRCDQQRRRQHL